MAGQFSTIHMELRAQAVPVMNFSCRSNLYLEQTNQNLQPKERTKGVCNGCWCQQWLIEDPVKQMRSNNNLVKCIFQFFQKLTRIELKYKMVARFTRLPAAIP
jgi:hypothetical protein